MNDEQVSLAAPAHVMAKPATMYDVAREAGVSHQTVSRYLKGYQGIRPETRERVEHALKALDYRMNFTARSLRTRQSHRIVALAAELDQVGPSRTAQGAIEGAREAGYLLDLIFLDVRDRASIDETIALVSRQDVAGILTLTSTDEMVAAFAHANFRGPVFVSAETDEDADVDQHVEGGDRVARLHTVGMTLLVDHLHGLGHERVFYIGGPLGWVSARNRLAAFEHAMTSKGLHPVGFENGDWSAASGYAAAMRIPESTDMTALVVANDQMALGAMLALVERGWRIPEDVSVVGFDNIPEAAFFRPPLTTVAQNFNLQGREAFGFLLKMIEGPSAPTPLVPTVELMVRRSSGPAAYAHRSAV